MKYKQIKRGEIYYADLNPVVGSEQGGRRPVLILQNDISNKHSPVTIVAAITSNRDKTYLPNDIAISPACLPAVAFCRTARSDQNDRQNPT